MQNVLQHWDPLFCGSRCRSPNMLYFYLFVKKIERIYTFYRVFYHLWSIPIESGDRMSLSKKLSYLKHKEKLTTLEIAQRTSLPVGTLNKIFSGQTLSPSLKIIDRLSTLFHVPSHYLIDDEIPVGCSIGAYVESQGLLMLSEREGELFDLFRQLDEQISRQSNGSHVRLPASPPSRKTPCSSGGCCVIRLWPGVNAAFIWTVSPSAPYLRLSVPSHERPTM